MDELQDSSKIDLDILERVTPWTNIVGVGDSLQSIMGFRGALATNMVDFRNIFNAEIAELTYNFRCDTNIINVANSFLNGEATLDPFSTNPGHVSYTEFDTQNQELDWIARSIDGMVG